MTPAFLCTLPCVLSSMTWLVTHQVLPCLWCHRNIRRTNSKLTEWTQYSLTNVWFKKYFWRLNLAIHRLNSTQTHRRMAWYDGRVSFFSFVCKIKYRHTLYHRTVIYTVHTISQFFTFASLSWTFVFYFVPSSKQRLSSEPLALHIRVVRYPSQTFPFCTLHTSTPFWNLPIHLIAWLFSDILSASYSFVSYTHQPGHSEQTRQTLVYLNTNFVLPCTLKPPNFCSIHDRGHEHFSQLTFCNRS